MKYDAIVFIGAPGIGKGTQAAMACEYSSKYHHVSTGDMLRNKEYMIPEFEPLLNLAGVNKGEFSPDKAIISFFDHVLKQRSLEGLLSLDQTLLLDGLPRTIPQIELLVPLVNFKGVLYFNLPEKEVEQRYISRAKKGERLDDKQAKYTDRKNTYELLTKPVIPEFEALGVPVKQLICKGTKEKVFSRTRFFLEVLK